jgi:hypothetical protein
MPVKRRAPKRRTSDAAELERWEMVFECGADLFRDVGGILEDKARVVAREPWHRLGRRFLAQRDPNAWGEVPWALKTFGEPPCR